MVNTKKRNAKLKPVVKAKPAKPARRRLNIVDVEATPNDVLTTASALEAIEAAKALVYPCKDCGQDTNPSTRSLRMDGQVFHIGCPKVKPRELTRRPAAIAGLPKVKGVNAPVPPTTQVGEFGDIKAVCDYNSRTVLQVKRDISTVTYIPIDASGFHLAYMSVQKFDERFKPIDYPVVKACEHYVRYAVEYGATQDVLDYLGRVVTITEEQTTMAKKTLANKTAVVVEDKSGKKVKVEKQPRGETASGLFKQLIMEGKLTDEDIFKKVQDKFDLDDKKRGYVAWYRNNLKKTGANPPDPKEPKAAKPEPKAKAEKVVKPKAKAAKAA